MLLENYQVAEGLLTGRDWFFDHFTLPDAYFFWCFRRGMQFKVDQSGFPICRAHFERVSRRLVLRNSWPLRHKHWLSWSKSRSEGSREIEWSCITTICPCARRKCDSYCARKT